MIKTLCLLLFLFQLSHSQQDCGIDYCASNVCDYGRYMINGCKTCSCNPSPCLEIQCNPDENCQVLKISDGIFRANCTKLQATSCPARLNCSPSNCIYGFKSDSNGCPSCSCYEPCENYLCQENQECRVTNVECPPPGCIDPPMPYCAYSQSVTTKPLLGGEQYSTRSTTTIRTCYNIGYCPFGCTMEYNYELRTFEPKCIIETMTPSTTTAQLLIGERSSAISSSFKSFTNPTNVCYLPVNRGIQCDSRETVTRWYYEPATGLCHKFPYPNPCNENKHNNFDSEEKCFNTCVCPSEQCELECLFGKVKNYLGCYTCQCLDPCLGYSCEKGSICEVYSTPFHIIRQFSVDQKPICLPDCPLKVCPYGFKYDTIDKCSCNDPCDLMKCKSGLICRRKKTNSLVPEYAAECQTYHKAWTMNLVYNASNENFTNMVEIKRNIQAIMMALIDKTPTILQHFNFGFAKDKFDIHRVNIDAMKIGIQLFSADILFVANSIEDDVNLNKLMNLIQFALYDGNRCRITVEPLPRTTSLLDFFSNESDYKILIIVVGITIPILVAVLAICIYRCYKSYRLRKGFAHRNLTESVISGESIPYAHPVDKGIDESKEFYA